MAEVISINSVNNQSYDRKQHQKETAQNVATGVGVTGYASRYASKRGILGSMLEKSNQTARIVGKNTREAGSLLSRFRLNTRRYTGDIIRGLSRFENNRFLAPIIKSPLIKRAASGIGGVMAFFVFITSIKQSVETGKLAIGDARGKYYDMTA